MTNDTKETLFPITYASAVFFYAWAIISLWVGPDRGLTGDWYLALGVIPAFLGVTSTVMALALHLELQDGDSAS
ncbi:hypothetical protein GGP53_000332 [Salinibacter ruber]|uniref:hypothetical protein n=1 Tax=Salinibacter ruber TaxID=146919 RepID=UPI0021681460|nr:hypothetical protein [Salinibacter ruber]MCS3626759.1 hypothetical protein [Salinibacter ruber]MCS4143405.1 hypothetical protein [Salinibacter ruber]